jgi:hypothetical protein
LRCVIAPRSFASSVVLAILRFLKEPSVQANDPKKGMACAGTPDAGRARNFDR